MIALGKTMKQFLLVAALASLFVHSVIATELPPPPSGFTWQEIPELKAAFLRPNGWFLKQEKSKDTMAYFITKENIENDGEFQTGLTVNVFRLKKDLAVEKGRSFIDQLATAKRGEKWAKDVGSFKEFGCLVKDTDASGTITAQYLMVANPKTNTLYLFIFESPVASWDSAWKIGKQILDSLVIDDEV